MAMRQQIDRYRSEIEEFQDLFSDLRPLWNAWDIYMDLDSRVDTFRAVNSSSGAVIFFLRAERALDVLSWLAQDDRIHSAEFETSIRKVGQLEEFAIKVHFRNVPLPSQQANSKNVRWDTSQKTKLIETGGLAQSAQIFPLKILDTKLSHD